MCSPAGDKKFLTVIDKSAKISALRAEISSVFRVIYSTDLETPFALCDSEKNVLDPKAKVEVCLFSFLLTSFFF